MSTGQSDIIQRPLGQRGLPTRQDAESFIQQCRANPLFSGRTENRLIVSCLSRAKMRVSPGKDHRWKPYRLLRLDVPNLRFQESGTCHCI